MTRFWRDTRERVAAAERHRLQAFAVSYPVVFAVVAAGKWLAWDLPCRIWCGVRALAGRWS